MSNQLRISIGAISAVALAAWLYIKLPGAGLIAFLAIGVFAVGYSFYAFFRKKGGDSGVKRIWKAVFDFFWGI